ncbi:hypothetical protein V6N12_022882 [Hibiscus sabdariffa]|uniref:Uncharacterized protein n=1 Tax=Hibiscus sabdariffa TaxID=183260 RepID=A0ABR2FW09_9ROSI
MRFGKVAHDLVMRMQKIDGDNYPELVLEVDSNYCGNTAKGYLDPNTTAKIHVTGNKFHNKLLEIIDPRLLGMTLTGGIFMLAKKLQAFVTRKMNLVAAACVVNKLSCFV